MCGCVMSKMIIIIGERTFLQCTFSEWDLVSGKMHTCKLQLIHNVMAYTVPVTLIIRRIDD